MLFVCFVFLEHRLSEQEASDEIRALLSNFVIQLQSVKDRVPSRGSAMTTISILLDTAKPLSNPQTSLVLPSTATSIKKSSTNATNSVSVNQFRDSNRPNVVFNEIRANNFEKKTKSI